MPIPKDIAYDKIGFPSPGSVKIFVDNYGGAKFFDGPIIPLDGHKYQCDGIVILKSGFELRAKFNITTSKDKIIIDNVLCFLNGLWYSHDEDQLFHDLKFKRDDVLPMMCSPDRNLSGIKGPFPIGSLSINKG